MAKLINTTAYLSFFNARVVASIASAVAVAAIPVMAGQANAQSGPPIPEGFDLHGSMRLRYETVSGQVRPGFNPSDELVDLRTIVTATYKSGPFRAGAEVYDSRAWLANAHTPVSTNEVNALEPVQAWVAVDIAHPFGKGTTLALQGGRFQLNLGSRRLVAGDDYRGTTNGFTGLRADIGIKPIKATLIYVLPQQRRPDDLTSVLDNKAALDREGFDQVLWGGTASWPGMVGKATGEIGFFHFGERDTPGHPTRDRSLNNVDLRLLRNPARGSLDYEVEGIYQSGQTSTGLTAGAPQVGVSAWFTHASIGYTFASSWQPRLSADFDLATGDRAGGRYTRFDSLFGMRRADLGPVGLYNVVARTNVLTPGLRLEAVPDKRFDVMVDYRLLWLAQATDSFAGSGVIDSTGRSGRFAGQQIDARVRSWLVPQRLRFEADAVWLAKGRFLSTAPNAPASGNSKYLSLSLTASL